jgi:multidrug efflux pump subunit AcrA (membrane-fusion protein)
MQRNRIWPVCGLLALALGVSGCAKTDSSSESGGDPAATLVEVEGSDVPRVVLDDRAESRIGLEMAAVGATVPYAALIYGADGSTYVYTQPKAHAYERTEVEVADIQGDDVTLVSGPADGEEVVTIGSAELFGVEQGIGG